MLHNVHCDLGMIAAKQGDYPRARKHLDKALTVARASSHRIVEALALQNRGWLALMQEDYPTARKLFEEGLLLARALGDEWAVCLSLTNLCCVVVRQGDFSIAGRVVEEAVSSARNVGERFLLPFSLDVFGQLSIAEGRQADARAPLRESLLVRRELGSRSGITYSLESIAALAAAESEPLRAIHLAGAAAAVREKIGERLSPMGQSLLEQWLVPLRETLEHDTVRSAWETGRVLSLEQAVELALVATQPPFPQTDQLSASERGVGRLSPREQQVAGLLAEGLTNRQIAVELVVTQRTVASHIEHILEKLGFASRHQVAGWAAEHGLQGATAAGQPPSPTVGNSHR
jgi:DNA-binding CsgD family transcriptional regulator